MITTRDEYLASVSPQGQSWLREFFDYMDSRYPQIPLIMFRQCPMYRFKDSYLKGYVMFTAASTHFSLHTLDFELIVSMKPRFPGAHFGKGCVKVKFKDTDLIPALKELCDQAIARNAT